MNRQQAIGIIDSGVGGLTVAREIFQQLPNEKLVYVGDNARCPYGSRSADEIRAFTYQMIRFLEQFSIKALVIACNTAAAVVLEELVGQSDLPIIGVIEPGARAAISASRSGRIGIIGTETTVRTQAYVRALRRINPDLYFASLACPAFVPLVEGQLLETEEAHQIVTESLEPLKREGIDTLILGCTHYPLLAPLIQDAMGNDITLINSGEETALGLSNLLAIHDLHAASGSVEPTHRFFTSGDPQVFKEIGDQWLNRKLFVERFLPE
ncbi:glutamate racemase [Brevibacillus fluminis]|uniref:Glutamate racemase n=1 Tax=Brevibacillus fluminis TaxID=511487 RepID=A0A3M8DQW2_9BACL|nr:glutamate racemase [Brevibacillus fluminis]RNB90516.1 glutamate racemase [Brevibacillus fluminis]